MTISNIPYVSEAFFEREKDVWKNSWLMVGREQDIKDNGQFVTIDIKVLGVSIAVLRDGNGELGAFYNICPHRNGRLFCDRMGKKAAIVCRFHGWTFGLDGKLRGVPEQHIFEDLDKNELGLQAVSVDTWGGFIFVNLDPQPAHSMREYMQGVTPGLDAYLTDPRWNWHTGYQHLFNANWKDLMNIQHEGYHATHVHKTTLGLTFGPDECRNTLFENSPGLCSLLTVLNPLGAEELLPNMTPIQNLSMKYGTTANWVEQNTSRPATEVENAVNLGGSDRWIFD